MAPGFGPLARRIEGGISGYSRFNATAAYGTKNKQEGVLIFFGGLFHVGLRERHQVQRLER
jgi:hypothetical protein